MAKIAIAVTLTDLGGPSLEFGRVDLDRGSTVATRQVVMVHVDDAPTKQALAAVSHDDVDVAAADDQLLQLGVDGGERDATAVAHDETVEVLGTDEALHPAQGADDLSPLCGDSRRAHVRIVPRGGLLFGTIPTNLIGMVPKRTLAIVGLLLGALSLGLVVFVFSAIAVRPIGRPVIVAGVTQWAALTRQVVGPDAKVVSLLSDPNADPHSHEATTSDAASVAEASVVVENGAGYDAWLAKLVAGGSSSSVTIRMSSLMGVATGSNPHIFYNVMGAERLVRALDSRLAKSGRFRDVAARSAALLAQLSATQRTIRSIARTCANVPVAATEDVTGYLLGDLGLRVVTPESLRVAIGNSVDPSVRDLATALGQLRQHPAFLVNNVQTATPLTNEMVRVAASVNVPVINVSETMRGNDYLGWINGVVGQIRAALRHEGCAR